VCVATYRRPVLLRSLLQSLGALTNASGYELILVVVDNDVNRSAEWVVEGMCADLHRPIRYAVEPVPNISLARNAGVRIALDEDADFLAFIDDDEVADPNWLDALLTAQRRFNADAVSGAVVSRYPSEAPDWIIRGAFFEQPRFATGYLLPYAHTNNVLVARKLFEDLDAPFDPAFGRTGGEDSHFFIRARRAGARLVWMDEAVVEEQVPVSRARAGWILRRAFRIGNAGVWCEKDLAPHVVWLVPRAVIAAGRLLQGAVVLIPAAAFGRASMLRALWKMAYGLGCLSALTGFRYREYDEVHGF
jgi:GT2 family glycosyltransferase